MGRVMVYLCQLNRILIMKSKILFALCISFSIIFNGCSMPTVYLAPSGQQIANQHEILGIVPPSITLEPLTLPSTIPSLAILIERRVMTSP